MADLDFSSGGVAVDNEAAPDFSHLGEPVSQGDNSELSQWNPTFLDRTKQFFHNIRTSAPVETLLGRTPEEIQENPALESAPTTTDTGVMGLFQSKTPLVQPYKNPQTALEGLHNWAAGVVNSVASLGGIATIPLAGAEATPMLVKKALGITFGAQGAKLGYEGAKDIVENHKTNNPAQTVQDIGNILAGTLMTAGGAHAATSEVPVTPENELHHGDTINATLPNGKQVNGTIIGSDENGNALLVDHSNGQQITLPEKLTQPEVQNASTIPKPIGVPQLEVRPSVGAEAPLRQSSEGTAAARPTQESELPEGVEVIKPTQPPTPPVATAQSAEPPTVPHSEKPSEILPVRSQTPAPPRPQRNGRDTTARDAWDEQYGMMRKGGRTHNDDGTPYQPTVLDEVMVNVNKELSEAKDQDEASFKMAGQYTTFGLGNRIKAMLDAGWKWDSKEKRMVNPNNPAQKASQFGKETAAEQPSSPSVVKPTPPVATGQLTPEASQLLKSGGVPAFVTKNLEKIARDNGVEPTGKNPNQIIAELKAKQSQPPQASPKPTAINPGGSLADLPPELRAKSDTVWGQQRIDAEKAIAARKLASTAPEPDSRVVVQHWPQMENGETPPSSVQIAPKLKEGETEAIGAATPEQLRTAGHDVPDFSNLPTGKYNYQEAKMLSNIGKDAGFRPQDRKIVSPTRGSMEFTFSDLPEGHPLKDANFTVPFDPKVGVTREAIVQRVREAADRFKQSAEQPEPQVESVTPLDENGNPLPIGSKPVDLGADVYRPRTDFGTAGAPRDIAGIAHRVQLARAEGEQQDMPVRGEGISPAASVERGRSLISEGADPEAILQNYEKTKRFSDDDVAIVRAHAERLKRDTNQVAEKYGSESPEYKLAKDAENQWLDRIQPIKTAWSRAGSAMQGETDVDTGTWTGLQRGFSESHEGKPLPKNLVPVAKAKATAVKKANADVDEAENKLVTDGDKAFGNKEGDETKRFGNVLDRAAYNLLKSNPFLTRDELVARLHDALKGDIPNLTPEMVEDALSKYGEVKLPSKDPIRQKLTDYKGQMRERGKLRSMQAGEPSKRTGFQRTPPSAEERALIKQVAEAKRKGGFNITDPEKQLRTALQAAKTRAQHSIEDLEREIENRQRNIKEKTASPSDPELEALKQKLAETRSRHSQVFGDIDVGELKEKLAAKQNKTFTPEESKQIWSLAKSRYLERGVRDLDTVAKGLGNDLGLFPEQIVRAITQNKTVKKLADDVWRKQSDQRRLKADAELWVKYADSPALYNFVRLIPSLFFNIKTAWHGTVWGGTHAPIHALTPQSWSVFYPQYFRSFVNMVNKGQHERYLRSIENDPDYTFWKRAGLEIDVNRAVDQYANADQVRFFKGFGKAGNRGFDSLKGLRLGLAKKLWNETDVKTDARAQQIKDWVNHSTGALGSDTATSRFLKGTGARTALFAPALYGSRFAVVGDVGKALTGFRKGATPEERANAVQMSKQIGSVLGVYAGLLVANQAYLSAIGSKDKINLTDPSKPDFLAFKAGSGIYIGVGSGFIGIAKLVSRLYQAEFGTRSGIQKLDDRSEKAGGIGGQYVRGLAAPWAGFGTDLITGEDITHRPLPGIFGDRNVVSRRQQELHPQFTYPEYLAGEFSPIPISEAWQDYHNQLIENGVPQNKTGVILKSIGEGIGSGLTGFRFGEYEPTAN